MAVYGDFDHFGPIFLAYLPWLYRPVIPPVRSHIQVGEFVADYMIESWLIIWQMLTGVLDTLVNLTAISHAFLADYMGVGPHQTCSLTLSFPLFLGLVPITLGPSPTFMGN